MTGCTDIMRNPAVLNYSPLIFGILTVNLSPFLQLKMFSVPKRSLWLLISKRSTCDRRRKGGYPLLSLDLPYPKRSSLFSISPWLQEDLKTAEVLSLFSVLWGDMADRTGMESHTSRYENYILFQYVEMNYSYSMFFLWNSKMWMIILFNNRRWIFISKSFWCWLDHKCGVSFFPYSASLNTLSLQ